MNYIVCGSCAKCWKEGDKPYHDAHCPQALKVTHRKRRGKLVAIPEEWQGKVTYKQTKNKRQPVNRRTRKSKK